MKKQVLLLMGLFLALTTLFMTACNSNSADTIEETVKEEKKHEPEAKTVAKQEKKGLKVGDTASDFQLQNIDGKMVGMKDFPDAKGYIITFTCNTCPYAVAYEDRIIELHNQYASQGYPVIAIQPNDPDIKKGDSYERMQKRAADKGFSFPYLMDDGSVVAVYGATKTPEIYLLDKDLTVRYTGAIDDNYQDADGVKIRYVEDAIAALETGKDPSPSLTKAVGCGIKPKQPKKS